MDTRAPRYRLPTLAMLMLVVLRAAIGWHLLYEGIVKLVTPGWTSKGYLLSSTWVLAEVFQKIVDNPMALKCVDVANILGLILIGTGLMLGCFSRAASLFGALLLALYYAAQPPFMEAATGAVREGSYLIVDKNFVELLALCVLAALPSGALLGLDRIIIYRRVRKLQAELQGGAGAGTTGAAPGVVLGRREMFKGLATLPFAFAFVAALLRRRSQEEGRLVDAVTSATMKTFKFASLSDLKGQVPKAKIKDVEVSRLILGGNLIGGWAHSRDLTYVSKLVKAYHDDDRVFETFRLAEECGINTILTNPALCRVINEYWKRGHGKIQFFSDCGGSDLLEGVQKSIDNGATGCYVHGGIADSLAKEGKVDQIGKALELMRKHKVPAGIGGHRIETIKACVEAGLAPDFWMKTLHHNNYWSAKVIEENYSTFCLKPDETIAYMKELKAPWIAFKTLSAGAIKPEEGFKYAFENGADFICVGMYDFQIVEDANLALEVLDSADLKGKRQRAWMA
ncbi:MAG: hypothetical protein JXQ73_13760 [Phycisphaerae bacterium]|nr:hypothetical protein [Phycisphaerae bacterium]